MLYNAESLNLTHTEPAGSPCTLSYGFVFTAHRTAGNDDVLFTVLRFIEKAGDEVTLRRNFFMAYGTYPFYTRHGFRITVRTAEYNTALIAYRHRPKNARIQIFFI